MIKRFIHAIARPHHPWREMQFDELAEIYTSMSLRSFGFGIIGIFVPVYLYANEMSLQGIFLFFTLFFMMRAPLAFIAAFVVGRIGPKHTIAVSTIVVIAFLTMLLTYSLVGWSIFMLALVFTVANGLFFVAYNTDFSKIKDKKHGGKELGWLLIFEQVGKALGPVVGGLLAGIFVPEFTLVFAITILIGSLIPLFLTNEPVKVHQHVSFRSFSVRKHASDFISIGGFNIQNVAINVFWPLLVAVFIFTEDTYEKLGILIGVTMAISIFSAHMFGKFIDSKKGGQLLKYGVFMNVVLMISKSLVTGSGGAIAVSTLGQPILLAYKMPLAKGMYDAADETEKHRIVYLAWQEAFAAVAKSIFCIGLLAASFHFEPISVLRVGFALAPFAGLLMLTQTFTALKTYPKKV